MGPDGDRILATPEPTDSPNHATRFRALVGLGCLGLSLTAPLGCGGASGSRDDAAVGHDAVTRDASVLDASEPDAAPLGAPCAQPGQCASEHCVDAVCCESACDTPCTRCTPGTGTCEAMPTGEDTGCETHCVEGQCQPCPADMVFVPWPAGDFCMDRYEAPNRQGARPLVMYTFVDATAWCSARGRRLCFDDEWTHACAGPDGAVYPYGDTHQPGVCNDDETWLAYSQPRLNNWPPSVCTEDVTSLEGLLADARAVSTLAADAADHIEELYQGEPSGANAGCTNDFGAFDLCGNIEEWTRLADGGSTDFHGSLKGRYWAEDRTCSQAVTNHGDYFRFYEIGFRCCMEPVL